jgi:hypothetical protein
MVVIPMIAIQVAIDIRSFKLGERGDKSTFYRGKPLYDEILDNIKFIKDKPLGMGIADWLLNSFLIISAVYFMIHPIAKGDRSLLLRRTVVLMTWAYGLRIFTLSFTRVPSALPHCKVGDYQGLKFFQRMLDISSSCSDMIFSGHTCTTFILLWGWLYNRNPVSLKIYAFLMSLGSTMFFLFQRYHYTVDVILGIYISVMLSLIYSLILYLIDQHDKAVELHGEDIQSIRIKESILVRTVRWIEIRDSTGTSKSVSKVPF